MYKRKVGSRSRGFTLIEILVVVLIIGILGAIALPQYQRAVLKSRFAALMPIAKAMADSNEAYYLEYGEYAEDAEDLPIQGRMNYPDGTTLEFGTTTAHAYVLATRGNDFPNNYIVYQKHSENYPGEVHCEAASDNTLAQDVCKSFGPTQELGETLTPGYLTYVLFDTGNGVAPSGDEGGNEEPETPTCPDNSVCDEDGNVTGCSTGYKLSGDACVEIPPCQGKSCDDNGNITECASGKTLNNGVCEDCTTAFPGATSCSATSYAATACATGYVLKGTACITQTAALQALAASLCPANRPQYVCTINSKNGTVSRCYTDSGTINEQGECVSNGTETGYYEVVHNPDGTEKQTYWCGGVSSGHCYHGRVIDYAAGTGKNRKCANNAAISKDLTCANGYAQSGYDYTYDSHGNQTDYNRCSAINEQGVCTRYDIMAHYDYTYDANGNQTGRTDHSCTSIKPNSTKCLTWDPPL